MAGKKKARRKRKSVPVRVIPIIGTLAFIQEATGYSNFGPLNEAVGAYRSSTRIITKMDGGILRGAVGAAGGGVVSTMHAKLNPHGKLSVGGYCIRP